ncbi:MAG TPA: helix-turn-helix domain-containing protein [Kouleothrix sp.]|jgi:AcrR family transcriptional regulator|uniref:TetR/AcrR family transcriptional regulator n=1 Tax=Kouleothrix sp. TaxID=2779161 RepID=UPI002B92AE0E|nr:helix-turn-helix domain-containing protein [Kouleothrix sp.]
MPQPAAARRHERAQRILDAAAALILRWGYNKTTIDDIARQAGVAKGTIYLHWNTREELFGALMLREKAALAADLRARTAADPAGATLPGLLKHSVLALMARPLLKAVLLRDIDIVGKLAQGQHSTAAYAERLLAFQTYLEFLRQHGLVRADQSLAEQVYVVSAIFMGYFTVATLMPPEFRLPDDRLAELLAETTRRALEPGSDADPAAREAAAQAFAQYLDRSIAANHEQLRQAIA